MTKSLIVNILKLFVNHAYLPVWNTKALSINKTLDGSHLIQQNNIIVLNGKINCIKIALQKLILELINSSLSQPKIKDATEHFEQVFGHVVVGWINVTRSWGVGFADLDVEFVTLLGDHVREDAWLAEDESWSCAAVWQLDEIEIQH